MLSITAVGNLASDPVQKETSQGTKVTNFRLLTDIQDVTVQIDCTVWGNREMLSWTISRKAIRLPLQIWQPKYF